MTENKYESCDKEKLDAIQRKVFESWSTLDENEEWMTGTVILENGVHLALESRIYASDELNGLVDEVFDLAGGDSLLIAYAFSQLKAFNSCNYARRREEALGWKPGMTLGTPDVPQEVVESYVGVTFECPNCGSDE